MSSILSAHKQAYAQSLLASALPVAGQAKPVPAALLSTARADFADSIAMPAGVVPDNTADSVYAKIIKNGKVVGTVYNGGSAVTGNGPDDVSVTLSSDGVGPDLAKKRAEEIAAAVGGSVQMAASALTQSAWLATDQGKRMTGELAMVNQGKSAASKVEAQLLGQSDSTAAAVKKPAPGEEAKAEFMDLMKGDMAHKMRAMILKEMGLTEEDIQKMSPEEQRKVADEIRQRMEDKMKQAAGNSDGAGNKREANESTLKIDMAASAPPVDASQQVDATAKNQALDSTSDTLRLVLAQQSISSELLKKKSLLADA